MDKKKEALVFKSLKSNPRDGRLSFDVFRTALDVGNGTLRHRVRRRRRRVAEQRRILHDDDVDEEQLEEEEVDEEEEIDSSSSSSSSSEEEEEEEEEEQNIRDGIPVIHHPVVMEIATLYTSSPDTFGKKFDRLREICDVVQKNTTVSGPKGHLAPRKVAMAIRALGIETLTNESLRSIENGLTRLYGSSVDIGALIKDVNRYMGGL